MSLSACTAHTHPLPDLPERIGLGRRAQICKTGGNIWLPALDPRLKDIHMGKPDPLPHLKT